MTPDISAIAQKFADEVPVEFEVLAKRVITLAIEEATSVWRAFYEDVCDQVKLLTAKLEASHAATASLRAQLDAANDRIKSLEASLSSADSYFTETALEVIDLREKLEAVAQESPLNGKEGK